MRDFRFTDGSTLPVLRIHYTTLGRPRKDAGGVVRNAVLILHGTTGNGRGFLSRNFGGELFQAGQPLDTATHFIILPDGIGTGKSSRPSEGLHAKFPRYGYEDMVTAQYRLVTEGLGVNHLLLVMGTSMGGMQTWMWGERYADFMDGLMPLASVPTQIAGRNRMMRAIVSKAIREDPDWKNGEYTAPPRGLMTGLSMLWMMTSSPLQQHKDAPTRDSADAVINRYMDQRMRTTDANDFLYQYEASRDYDPSSALEKIKAPVVAINSADGPRESARARAHGATHAACEARPVRSHSHERPNARARNALAAGDLEIAPRGAIEGDRKLGEDRCTMPL
jgi:homoserine O-acetyltransferase